MSMRKLLLLSAICWSAASFGIVSNSSTNYFSHCVQIEATGYEGSSALEAFPVLVRVGSSIPGFSMSMLRDPRMRDLTFFDMSDAELPSEFDGYDSDGAALYWVHVTLEPKEQGECRTKFLMCFGGKDDGSEGVVVNGTVPSSTWESCFGVWHMSEEYGTAYDSTANWLDGFVGRESHSSEMRGVKDGAVGVARMNQSFSSPAGAYLEVPDFGIVEQPDEESGFAGLGSRFSFSGWFRANEVPSGASPKLVSCMKRRSDAGGWEIAATGANTLSVRTGAAAESVANVTCSPSLVGEWNLLNFSFDGSTLHVFQNGDYLGEFVISPVATNNVPLSFGCDSDGDAQSWNGQYDELRLYCEPSSAEWAKAEYDTVVNPSFLSYGPVDGKSDAPRFEGRPVVTKGQTDTNFEFSVTLAQGRADVFAVFTDVLTGETVTNQIASASNVSAPTDLACSVPALVAGRAYVYSAYAVATVSGDDGEYKLTALAEGENAFSYGSYQAASELYGMRLAFVATRYSGAQAENRQVLVRLGEDVSGFYYDDFAYRGTGGDIFFTDASGNEIPHEVETWNPSGESLVRVRLPSLASNTVFYAYYSGPEAAGDHEAVWAGSQEPPPGERYILSSAATANSPFLPIVVPTGVSDVGTETASAGFFVVSLAEFAGQGNLFSHPRSVAQSEGKSVEVSLGAVSYALDHLSPVTDFECSLNVGGTSVSQTFKTAGLVEFSNVSLVAGNDGLTASCNVDSGGCGIVAVLCYMGTDPEDLYEFEELTPGGIGPVSVTLPYECLAKEDFGIKWYVAFRGVTYIDETRGYVFSDSPMAECLLVKKQGVRCMIR